MGDILRYVALDAGDKPETLLDLNDMSTLMTVRDSFKVTAPVKQQVNSASGRRYGGSTQVAETHENGSIAWVAMVSGATADACLAKVAELLAQIEANPWEMLIEWQPDGASKATYYEVRGTAQWDTEYKWASFAGAQMLLVSVTVPVGPLAQGLPVVVLESGTEELPQVLSLESIEGDAPAKAQVAVKTEGGEAPPIWALLGWAAKPVAGLAQAPFGILEGESATLSNWSKTLRANVRGGAAAQVAEAKSGTTYRAGWLVDPATMVPDSFGNEIAVEVWARVYMAATVKTPIFTLSAQPQDGTNFGAARYSDEWGSKGKQLVVPSADAFRFVRLGTVRMLVDPVRPREWNLVVEATVGSGSSGNLSLDYIVCVPVTSRACSPSNKENDSSYPKFIASTETTVKTINHDLSALVRRPEREYGHPDHGLGGQLLEMPPGETQLLVKLSSLVPDNPSVSEASEQLAHKATTVIVKVTPRWYLARH